MWQVYLGGLQQRGQPYEGGCLTDWLTKSAIGQGKALWHSAEVTPLIGWWIVEITPLLIAL